MHKSDRAGLIDKPGFIALFSMFSRLKMKFTIEIDLKMSFKNILSLE